MTEVVSIASEKVTEIDDEIETEVSESEGEVDETDGNSDINLDYSSAVINKVYKHFHNTDIINSK